MSPCKTPEVNVKESPKNPGSKSSSTKIKWDEASGRILKSDKYVLCILLVAKQLKTKNKNGSHFHSVEPHRKKNMFS